MYTVKQNGRQWDKHLETGGSQTFRPFCSLSLCGEEARAEMKSPGSHPCKGREAIFKQNRCWQGLKIVKVGIAMKPDFHLHRDCYVHYFQAVGNSESTLWGSPGFPTAPRPLQYICLKIGPLTHPLKVAGDLCTNWVVVTRV